MLKRLKSEKNTGTTWNVTINVERYVVSSRNVFFLVQQSEYYSIDPVLATLVMSILINSKNFQILSCLYIYIYIYIYIYDISYITTYYKNCDKRDLNFKLR